MFRNIAARTVQAESNQTCLNCRGEARSRTLLRAKLRNNLYYSLFFSNFGFAEVTFTRKAQINLAFPSFIRNFASK
jgi:hypothetical protein